MLDRPYARPVETPEDVVHRYDMAGLDGWVDEPVQGDGLGTIAFMMCLFAFAVVAICGGALLAVAWSAWDDIPARGVQDNIR